MTTSTPRAREQPEALRVAPRLKPANNRVDDQDETTDEGEAEAMGIKH
jgi:hypothetical protein